MVAFSYHTHADLDLQIPRAQWAVIVQDCTSSHEVIQKVVGFLH